MIFTQPDSVIANVYDPQTLNRYAFEKNNPYKYVDPNGKFAVLIGILAIWSIVTVIMLKTYALEIYHGIREHASFSDIHEAGATRAGQEVGGTLSFQPQESSNLVDIGFAETPELAFVGPTMDILEIITEVASGKKSSYLKDHDSKKVDFHTFNLRNLHTSSLNNYIFYNSLFQLSNQMDIAKQISSNINEKGSKTTYSLNNQCFCGIQPNNTYDSQTGILIDESGIGYSYSPDNAYKKTGGLI
jgi:hypothetical protein